MDSCCYFDNLYDPQIKLLTKYLIPIVIHCKRPDQIPLILWGDIHDLSHILHFPSNDTRNSQTPVRHKSNVLCLAFPPDSTVVASGSHQETKKVLNQFLVHLLLNKYK